MESNVRNLKKKAFLTLFDCVLSVTVTMEIETCTTPKYTNFPTTGYARPLKIMYIWRELGEPVQDVYFSLHTVLILDR